MNCENNRQLFPGLKLIKKEVNERFLEATRNIYTHHPAYKFDREEAKTKVLIYPSHGNPKYDGKQPVILSKVGSYQYHLQDTLNNNLSEEIIKDGVVVGRKSKQIIRMPITIMVQAYAEEESSDMADELGSLIIYACRSYYSSCGLVPSNIQVSETDLFNREQSIYQTVINAIFDVPWTNSTITESSTIIGEVIFDMELPKFVSNGNFEYRSPGVSVTEVREEELSFKTFHGDKVTIK